jgi:GH25 family lysozyme M1 (1,4-beta-N-acetylmuramidase)
LTLVCPALIATVLAMGVGIERATAQRPLGIDVSHYQGSIAWSSVSSSGIAFAWADATQGTTFTDGTFANNEAHAKTAGVLIGASHYARFDLNPGTAGADNEAAWFWSKAQNYIQGGGTYLMPMLDVEQTPGGADSKTTLSQWVDRWCQDIVDDGAAEGLTLKPVVYTYPSFASSWLDSTVTQWTPWLAQWSGNPQTGAPATTGPWSAWSVWQYSGNRTVPGISGPVDGDVFNGDASTLSTLVIVPEPATLLLLAIAALSCVVRRVRK